MRNFKFQKRCRWLGLSGLILICIFFYFFYVLMLEAIPDKIRIVAGREETFDLGVPVTGQIQPGEVEVFTNQSPKVSGEVHTNLGDSSPSLINMNDSFTISSAREGEFLISCKLFGIFDLKDVSVEVVGEQMVIPCGTPVGIYVKTEGILAIGTSGVTGIDGMTYEPALHIIQSGDYIKTVDNEVITSKEQLVEKVNASGGNTLVLGVQRGDELIRLKVTPVQTERDEYRLGIWVRDDLAGVGTMTYFTPDMQYGALGHPVSDVDTSTMIRLDEGLLYETRIVGITKGEKGAPGELAGVIDYQPSFCLGTVQGNSQTGIFGTLDRIPSGLEDAQVMEIGMKQELETGPAQIISAVSGEREFYNIEILELDLNSANENKGIQFQVTDQRLLAITGGIVQGMSGSPIIQNGKLVGAVTHVFVQDATKGYGVFLESMMGH